MAKRSYTEGERQTALRLYELEGPTAVEKKLGIPKNTVADWARQAGIRTVRNQKTREATEARVLDNKALREAVSSKSISAADKAAGIILTKLQQIEASVIDEGLRDIATVFGILADKHKMLTQMDQSSEEHSAVDEWLNHITGGEQ